MSEKLSAYDRSIHEELEKVDWDDVLPRVFKYAVARSKKFHWLGHQVDPEELVQEAIAMAYGEGEGGTYRNWNKETCPDITNFLIGIIRSITSHRAEHETTFPSEPLFFEDGSPKDTCLYEATDVASAGIQPKTPEDQSIERENLQFLANALEGLKTEDEDLGMVILAIEEGYSKPRFIAEATGIDIKNVNNLLRKLRRKLINYNPKMGKR